MKTTKRIVAALMALSLCAGLSGCLGSGSLRGENWTPRNDTPSIPEKLIKSESADGVPSLTVYDVVRKTLSEMDIETYVWGVVAGEMKNDWPEEALKAQAILARTFVLKFCQDKVSSYKGADISTDVKEAQAYAAEDVNERVREAVAETRGQVMAWNGEFPNAWFHAHSGGMTELPSVALDYREPDPAYLEPVMSEDSDKAPDSARSWTARFTQAEVKSAAAAAGLKVEHVESIGLGEKGESGRAGTLVINGDSVSAPSFRIQIGADRMRSTLIDNAYLDNESVVFKGRGFGHGVGMSQWGAYAMAKDGADAQSIIAHYFQGVSIVKLW